MGKKEGRKEKEEEIVKSRERIGKSEVSKKRTRKQ